MNVADAPFNDYLVYGVVAVTLVAMPITTWYLAREGKI